MEVGGTSFKWRLQTETVETAYRYSPKVRYLNSGIESIESIDSIAAISEGLARRPARLAMWQGLTTPQANSWAAMRPPVVKDYWDRHAAA